MVLWKWEVYITQQMGQQRRIIPRGDQIGLLLKKLVTKTLNVKILRDQRT